MKTFNVYRHTNESLEVVKVGFSWPAFIFGVFWMLFSELWSFAALWVAMIISVKIIEAVAGRMSASTFQLLVYVALLACYLLLWLIPAFNGNKWRDRMLSKREGYEYVGAVQAKNQTAAAAQIGNLA